MRKVLSAKVTITISSMMQRNEKEIFQMSWLTEFPWLALDADLGVMKCKLYCKWANVCDPKNPLVIGSDKFRKDLLYTHAKIMLPV